MRLRALRGLTSHFAHSEHLKWRICPVTQIPAHGVLDGIDLERSVVFQINHDDVEHLGLGSCVLGSGGGGDPALASLMLHAAIDTYGPIDVVDPSELPADGLLLPIAVIGAGVPFQEKLLNGNEAAKALSLLETRLGKKGVAVLPIEVGGVNTLFPLAVAASLGLPCVDGDAMRRAFPSLELTVFELAGISSSPSVMVDSKGNSVLLEAVDNLAAENFSRATVIQMGMFSVISAYPVTAQQVVDHGISGSLSYALQIGRLVAQIQKGNDRAFDDLFDYANARVMFTGKVADLERRITDGWTRGTVTLEHLTDPTRVMRVDIQNENLMAFEDGVPKITTPDLITMLDAETGTPMTTDTLAYGQRLHVVGLPAHPYWHTDAGIALAGPRKFGYDVDYVSFGAEA